jgi:hypothetical protein
MDIADLKKKFIVSESEVGKDLAQLVEKALEFCVVDNTGRVHLKGSGLPAKIRIKLILSARRIASQLDGSFSPELTIEEIALAAGMPGNQVRARLGEIVTERFAEASGRGAYKANAFRISAFLDELRGDHQ